MASNSASNNRNSNVNSSSMHINGSSDVLNRNSSYSGGHSSQGSSFCVLWNNYHGALVSTLGSLRKEGQLLDCTLACTDGGRIHAHQLILAACSTVCREFIKDTGDKHPVILLPSEVTTRELKAMVEFMYTGQVCVEQERLKAFIQGARYLRIKGLEDNTDDTDGEDTESRKDDSTENYQMRTSSTFREKEASRAAERSDKWQVVERKPIILPHSSSSTSGNRKRRRLSSSKRRPMHISNSVVCYEQEDHHKSIKQEDKSDGTEPINKIRRLSTMVAGHYHDDLEICTCSSRKTWSVADTEALLKVWRETLTQVPPSYFIRSMSLCKRVARNLQARGVQKNWRQCQVKMKNLRREVRLFKESRCRLSSRKPSEVANACEKLLPVIEEIFNREEEIRQEWYQLKTDDRQREDGDLTTGGDRDILAQVAVLADSDIGDDDTDGAGIDGDDEAGVVRVSAGAGMVVEDMVGVEVTTAPSFDGDVPHHSVHHQPDGSIHHIVQDVSLQFTKDETSNTSNDQL